jgi:hypothetical protein
MNESSGNVKSSNLNNITDSLPAYLTDSSLTDEKIRQSAKEEKPATFTFDMGEFPFERLGDNHFELLIADLFSENAAKENWDWYDEAGRLNDGADQGRDVILLKHGLPVGVVQCKRYKTDVTLPAALREICKFMMFSLIYPDIYNDGIESTRYILAAAESVTGPAYKFLIAEGRERFEEKALDFPSYIKDIRKKYTSLADHALIKDKTDEEVRILIWERMVKLKTSVYRKFELSRFVRACPAVRDTYFRLEYVINGSIGDVADLLEKFAVRLTGPINSQAKNDASKIYTAEIDLDILDGNRLNICLIQADHTNCLFTLTKFLSCDDDGPCRSNHGTKPVMIVTGAFAVSPDDWHHVDLLIQNYPGPIVLVAGCGEISGSKLKELKTLICGPNTWINSTEPASNAEYRVGWCWVKKASAEQSQCFILIENLPALPQLEQGDVSLRLAFNDVIVWPTLGDDFSCGWTSSKSTLRRVAVGIKDDRLNRPTLLAVAGHSDTFSEDAKQALADFHSLRQYARIAICIANSRFPTAIEPDWRGGSGFFPAKPISSIMHKQTNNIPNGAILRRDDTSVLTTVLIWQNEYLEVGKAIPYRIEGTNIIRDIPPEGIELLRNLRWIQPYEDSDPIVYDEIENLRDATLNIGVPSSGSLVHSCSYGVKDYTPLHADEIAGHGIKIRPALHAICYLKGADGASWKDSTGIGQITLTNGETELSLLSWVDGELGLRSMLASIRAWATRGGPHPPLLVLGRANTSPASTGEKIGHIIREDITIPSENADSITEPKISRSAYLFPIDMVTDAYQVPGGGISERKKLVESIIKLKEKLDDK